jgi:hypothetical protein
MKFITNLAQSYPYLIVSILSALTLNTPIASAENITVIEGPNNFPNGSTSEMVRPSNYSYGNGRSSYHPRYSPRNTVPYRLSPTAEGSPYFSYPRTFTPQTFTPRTASPSPEPRQTQPTMGLTYTSQGGLDYFSMYLEWGNIAAQQKQPQVALSWYQKALAMRPADKNLLRTIQSLQTPARK